MTETCSMGKVSTLLCTFKDYIEKIDRDDNNPTLSMKL